MAWKLCRSSKFDSFHPEAEPLRSLVGNSICLLPLGPKLILCYQLSQTHWLSCVAISPGADVGFILAHRHSCYWRLTSHPVWSSRRTLMGVWDTSQLTFMSPSQVPCHQEEINEWPGHWKWSHAENRTPFVVPEAQPFASSLLSVSPQLLMRCQTEIS